MPKQLHCHHGDCFNDIQNGFMHNLETTVSAKYAATQYCSSIYRLKGQPATTNITQLHNGNFSRHKKSGSLEAVQGQQVCGHASYILFPYRRSNFGTKQVTSIWHTSRHWLLYNITNRVTKYRGPIQQTTVSSNIIANLTLYSLSKPQETRCKNYPAYFRSYIYLYNNTTWKLIENIVVVVVVVVLVVVVVVVVVVEAVYSLQHGKLKISENFATLPTKFLKELILSEIMLRGKAETLYKLCTV